MLRITSGPNCSLKQQRRGSPGGLGGSPFWVIEPSRSGRPSDTTTGPTGFPPVGRPTPPPPVGERSWDEKSQATDTETPIGNICSCSFEDKNQVVVRELLSKLPRTSGCNVRTTTELRGRSPRCALAPPPRAPSSALAELERSKALG